MPVRVLDLSPESYRAHPLHSDAQYWPETNCYVDLWIEVIAALRLPPEAMLGFTVTQDFEGDQFTFFKVPLADLEQLYGIQVLELSIFDDLERHVREQLRRGRLVFVEVDGWFLPDTRGTSYRTTHPKTTIGINSLDAAARRMTYFHNAGFFALQGDDYDGIFGAPGAPREPARLFPYVEFAKLPEQAPTLDRRALARDLLRRHLGRRPRVNPVRAWQAVLPGQLVQLAERSDAFFHHYAFNTLRQVGANFELLATHLAWLSTNEEGALEEPGAAALRIAQSAKTLQFKLARAVARRRFEGFVEAVDGMASDYDVVIDRLLACYGSGAARRVVHAA